MIKVFIELARLDTLRSQSKELRGLEKQIEIYRTLPKQVASEFWAKTITPDDVEPDSLVGVNQFVVDLKRQIAIEEWIYGISCKFDATADWLRFFLLDDMSTYSELVSTWKANAEAFARYEIAKFQLVQALFLRLPELKEHTGANSPGELWTILAHSMLWYDLHAVFSGRTLCGVKGKTEWYKKTGEASERDASLQTPPPVLSEQLLANPQIQEMEPGLFDVLLYAIAASLAKVDSCFDADHWVPYCRAVRRFRNAVRKDKKIQFAHINNSDEFQLSAKSQQVEGKRRRSNSEV